jgi:hypothetical protein
MPISRAWSVFTRSSADAGVVLQAGLAQCRAFIQKSLDTYLEPDKTFVELGDMARSGTIDLLREFSDACHDEFVELRAQQF